MIQRQGDKGRDGERIRQGGTQRTILVRPFSWYGVILKSVVNEVVPTYTQIPSICVQ